MADAPRRGRPPADPEQVVEKLLDAASSEFNTGGYFGTDTNKIARAAKVSPATLYRHFDDKLDLFLTTYQRWVDSEWSVIESVPPHPDRSHYARAVVNAMLSHHERWRVVRASMHALIATEDRAQTFGNRIRRQQIARLQGNIDPSAAADQAALTFSFLAIERANNAITDGDLEAFGTDRDAFIERLVQEVASLQPENGSNDPS